MQDQVPTKGDPEAKINLVSFAQLAPLHSSCTPFGAKIELILRLAGLPYEAHCGDLTNTKTAPKSKACSNQLPFKFPLRSKVMQFAL